jgi:large subunit ribosomal protein L35Ae
MVKQYRHTSILRLQGVKEKKDAKFYLGKRVAYLSKSAANTKNSLHKTYQGRRVIWGKVIKTHGASGSVKAKFNPQLPPSSIGKGAKVFLYPSSI